MNGLYISRYLFGIFIIEYAYFIMAYVVHISLAIWRYMYNWQQTWKWCAGVTVQDVTD